jgi:diguanylate cyclase (GGDEF)-like protein
MIIPPIPPDEENRLRVLHSLNILDTPVEERFDRITRLAKRMFNVPLSVVGLIDEDRQWMKSTAGIDVKEAPRELTFCGHAILGDEMLIISDATQDERVFDHPAVVGEPYVRFYAGVPLRVVDGSKMGTLCIADFKPRSFNTEDYQALKDLGELVESELVAVQLATLDELTNISNRRGFILLAQKSLNLCARQKISASLIFIDLDNFKEINDTFGHAGGDNVLVGFAEQLKIIFRDSDVLARLGGDEFAILLAGTASEKAFETIERLRQSSASFFAEKYPGYTVSFSAGVKTVDFDQDFSVENLLSHADVLMYQNKSKK